MSNEPITVEGRDYTRSERRFASLASALPGIRSRHWLSVGDEEVAEDVSHPPTGMHQRVSQRDELADALQWLVGSERGTAPTRVVK